MISLGQADLPEQMLHRSSTLSWQHSCQNAGLLESGSQFPSDMLRNMFDRYEARMLQDIDTIGGYVNK